MKKMLVIVLLVIYGASAFAEAMHYHSRCSKWEETGVFLLKTNFPAENPASEAGPDCELSSVLTVLGSEHVPAKAFRSSLHLLNDSGNSSVCLVSSPSTSRNLLPVATEPISFKVPLFIFHCAYRI